MVFFQFVKLFIQPVLRCVKCNEYSHGIKSCRNIDRCSFCGGPHEKEICEARNPFCSNFQLAYEADDKICPHLNFNRQVNEVIANLNIPRTAAVYNVQMRFKNHPEMFNLGGILANLEPYLEKRTVFEEFLNARTITITTSSSSLSSSQRDNKDGNSFPQNRSITKSNNKLRLQFEANRLPTVRSQNHTNIISTLSAGFVIDSRKIPLNSQVPSGLVRETELLADGFDDGEAPSYTSG